MKNLNLLVLAIVVTGGLVLGGCTNTQKDTAGGALVGHSDDKSSD